MKEIIDKTLPLIPKYFSELLEVFFSPKRFLREKQLTQSDDIDGASLFMGLTILLAFVAQLPFVGSWKESPIASLASLVALTFLFALAALAVLRFSWLVVGGKATLKQLFATHTCQDRSPSFWLRSPSQVLRCFAKLTQQD